MPGKEAPHLLVRIDYPRPGTEEPGDVVEDAARPDVARAGELPERGFLLAAGVGEKRRRMRDAGRGFPFAALLRLKAAGAAVHLRPLGQPLLDRRVQHARAGQRKGRAESAL